MIASTFVASLEMVKDGRLAIRQANAFGFAKQEQIAELVFKPADHLLLYLSLFAAGLQLGGN